MLPTRSARSVLFKVTSAVTLTTESRGRPVMAVGRNTLPGMAANLVLEVMTAPSIVARRLRLYESAEMTSTGRRITRRDPLGLPRSAQ